MNRLQKEVKFRLQDPALSAAVKAGDSEAAIELALQTGYARIWSVEGVPPVPREIVLPVAVHLKEWAEKRKAEVPVWEKELREELAGGAVFADGADGETCAMLQHRIDAAALELALHEAGQGLEVRQAAEEVQVWSWELHKRGDLLREWLKKSIAGQNLLTEWMEAFTSFPLEEEFWPWYLSDTFWCRSQAGIEAANRVLSAMRGEAPA